MRTVATVPLRHRRDQNHRRIRLLVVIGHVALEELHDIDRVIGDDDAAFARRQVKVDELSATDGIGRDGTARGGDGHRSAGSAAHDTHEVTTGAGGGRRHHVGVVPGGQRVHHLHQVICSAAPPPV